MSDEKQNNSWQHKLEQLDHLPETEWTKDAAWEKLYNRLQEKPRRKKAIWYMAAAACLLMAVIISWMIMGSQKNVLATKPVLKKEQPVITKTLSRQQPAKAISHDSLIIHIPDPGTIKSESMSIAKALGKHYRGSNAGIDMSRVSTTIQSSLPVSNNMGHDTTTIARLPISLPDSQAVIVAAAPSKKKLKVVHLNELGNPMEDDSKMVRSANWHSFQVKFNSPDPFAQPFNLPAQDDNRSIKIKSPPQN
jgi:hypothetical protein